MMKNKFFRKNRIVPVLLTLCMLLALLPEAASAAESNVPADDKGETVPSAEGNLFFSVTPPTKRTYVVGDSLDVTGMEVYLHDPTSPLPSQQIIPLGYYTCTPTTFNEAGTVTVTITYQQYTATFDVTVAEEGQPALPSDPINDGRAYSFNRIHIGDTEGYLDFNLEKENFNTSVPLGGNLWEFDFGTTGLHLDETKGSAFPGFQPSTGSDNKFYVLIYLAADPGKTAQSGDITIRVKKDAIIGVQRDIVYKTSIIKPTPTPFDISYIFDDSGAPSGATWSMTSTEATRDPEMIIVSVKAPSGKYAYFDSIRNPAQNSALEIVPSSAGLPGTYTYTYTFQTSGVNTPWDSSSLEAGDHNLALSVGTILDNTIVFGPVWTKTDAVVPEFPIIPDIPFTPSTPSTGGSTTPSTNTTTDTNPNGSSTTTKTDAATGTVTETTKGTDGSETVVETKTDGTVTTTATDAEGNKTATTSNPDGSAVTTIANKDGGTSTTTVSATGQVTAAVTAPAAAVEAAQTSGQAVPLPMPGVPLTADASAAPIVTVTTGSDQPVKVEIPVEKTTPGTVAVIVKADGAEEVVKTSLATENGVTLAVPDGATVKIVDNSKSFADAATHWAGDAITFAAAHELFTGTGADSFTPNGTMTRGMMVTVLARYDGVDTSAGTTWYEKGVEWAAANNISSGADLDAPVSREQLAAMLYRYAAASGLDTAASSELTGFADAGDVSGYAAEAMAWAVGAGLIGGTDKGELNPSGSATRAEVATILMRFCENVMK